MPAGRTPAQKQARPAHTGDQAPSLPRPCPPFRAPALLLRRGTGPPCDGRPEAGTTKAVELGLRGTLVRGEGGDCSPRVVNARRVQNLSAGAF